MNEREEFDIILEFIEGADFDEILYLQQLRALWTAFCIHRDEAVDTGSYYCYMLEMWSVMEENGTNPYSSTEYERFYNAMCKYLV